MNLQARWPMGFENSRDIRRFHEAAIDPNLQKSLITQLDVDARRIIDIRRQGILNTENDYIVMDDAKMPHRPL